MNSIDTKVTTGPRNIAPSANNLVERMSNNLHKIITDIAKKNKWRTFLALTIGRLRLSKRLQADFKMYKNKKKTFGSVVEVLQCAKEYKAENKGRKNGIFQQGLDNFIEQWRSNINEVYRAEDDPEPYDYNIHQPLLNTTISHLFPSQRNSYSEFYENESDERFYGSVSSSSDLNETTPQKSTNEAGDAGDVSEADKTEQTK